MKSVTVARKKPRRLPCTTMGKCCRRCARKRQRRLWREGCTTGGKGQRFSNAKKVEAVANGKKNAQVSVAANAAGQIIKSVEPKKFYVVEIPFIRFPKTLSDIAVLEVLSFVAFAENQWLLRLNPSPSSVCSNDAWDAKVYKKSANISPTCSKKGRKRARRMKTTKAAIKARRQEQRLEKRCFEQKDREGKSKSRTRPENGKVTGSVSL